MIDSRDEKGGKRTLPYEVYDQPPVKIPVRLFTSAGCSGNHMAQKAKCCATEQSDNRGPPLRLHGEVWWLRGEEVELDGGANEESEQTTAVLVVSEVSQITPRGVGVQRVL